MGSVEPTEAKKMSKKLCLFILVVLLLAVVQPVLAQTPTPISPSGYQIDLSTGYSVTIIREITFGDIAVVVAVGTLTMVQILSVAIRWVRSWLR